MMQRAWHSLFRVPADLDAAERQGVVLAILLRTLVLLAVFVLQLIGSTYSGNKIGMLIVGVFVGLGGLHLLLIQSGLELRWHRLVFLTIDFAGLAAAAVLTPLTAAGDVPQILLFRSYGAELLALLVALSVLTLTPATVLWAGTCAIAMLWTVFLVLASGVERPLSWADLPPGATREQYVSLVLNPDFIGRGNRITETIALAGLTLLLAAAVARARAIVDARIAAEARREQIRSVFGQYVPEGVVEALVADGGILRPAERVASVLFADIAGFTRMSETLRPEALVPILNAYFDTVASTVARHGGVIISFNGDAVLAAFNVPLARPSFAADAVACARAMSASVKSTGFAGQRLAIRIGIATGAVAAGSVGGSNRQTYTVYGDTVNLAQRLEAHNKVLSTEILVCEATRDAVAANWALEDMGDIAVAGRAGTVRAFAA
jgi:class 3 adenylate cyclase